MAGKARIFQNETGDTGAIHSIGNGSIIGYGQGPNIVSVYAPYTSPNHFTLKVESDGRTWETSREPHTDIHHHHAGEGRDRIHMLDYCHTDYPCLIREIRCAETFSLELCFPGITDSHMSGLFADAGYQCITYVVKGGNPIIFHTSHTPFTGHVLISRACSSIAEIGANRWRITCSPGEAMLLASGAEDAGTVILGLREIVGSGLEGVQADRDVCVHANASAGPLTASHLEDRRVYWKRYAARRDTAGEPDYVDAAIVCIKTQQSVQGGLPSCRELQYGYSRDNYGPSRAFLALGYHVSNPDIFRKTRKWSRHPIRFCRRVTIGRPPKTTPTFIWSSQCFFGAFRFKFRICITTCCHSTETRRISQAACWGAAR